MCIKLDSDPMFVQTNMKVFEFVLCQIGVNEFLRRIFIPVYKRTNVSSINYLFEGVLFYEEIFSYVGLCCDAY